MEENDNYSKENKKEDIKTEVNKEENKEIKKDENNLSIKETKKEKEEKFKMIFLQQIIVKLYWIKLVIQ